MPLLLLLRLLLILAVILLLLLMCMLLLVVVLLLVVLVEVVVVVVGSVVVALAASVAKPGRSTPMAPPGVTLALGWYGDFALKHRSNTRWTQARPLSGKLTCSHNSGDSTRT